MEFATPTDEDIKKVKSAHPGVRLRMLSSHGATVIVRPPTEAEFARMQVMVADGGISRKLPAASQMLRDVCLWPPKEALADILKEYPGIGLNLVDDVLDMMGVGGGVEKKDL